jgi:hypothetical protein
MMKMLGLPVPRLRGFSLFKNWRRLNLEEKLRSTLGTIRRIITRRYHRPLRLKASEGENRSVLRKTEGVSRNVPEQFSPVEAGATRI